jgi:hypothetical protein
MIYSLLKRLIRVIKSLINDIAKIIIIHCMNGARNFSDELKTPINPIV